MFVNDVRARVGPSGGEAIPAPRRRRGGGDPTDRIGPGGRRRSLTLAIALRRRTRLFLAVLTAAATCALLVTALQPPLFTATSEVVLDAGDAPVAAETAPSAAAIAEADMARIRARGMAREVAAGLRLDRDPDFARRTGVGEELMRRLRRIVGADRARLPPIPPEEAMTRSIDRLVAGLSLAHVAETYSLTISATAETPQLAARIANAYARRYGDRPTPSGATPTPRAGTRIISEAEPPLAPSSPRPLRNLAIALALGALLGAGAAYLAEHLFDGLTSGDEVEDRLGLLHLGSVPALASVIPNAGEPLKAVVDHPMSGFAEAFRSVLDTVRETNARRAQVIAITSALPNEGKSTITGCLARTVALGGERIVLVDCDARRRDVSAMFDDAGQRPGLAEVLRGEATLDEALVHDGPSGAWILPLTGPAAELSALLAGPPMAALIEELRHRFARVLIDTAPVLALAETRVIATMVDLVIIVVRWRVTADHAVRAAVKLLPRAQGQIAGVVLSRVDMRRQARYAKGDASSYYRQYSKYYS